MHEIGTFQRAFFRGFPSKLTGMVVAKSPAKGGRKMKKTVGGALLALAFVFGIIGVSSTTAAAQYRTRDYGYGGYNNQQLQQGYQYGVNTGASDAQRRQSYSPQRSRYYRNASSQAFREGFVRGYDQGYRQYAYNNGGYRNDGYYENGGYRNDGYYGRNGGYGGYDNQELNRGYNQGIETGSSDAQKGQSYSPERSRHYRNASTQAFREGFVRGYDQGYRQYAGNGTYRRSNTAATILEQIFRGTRY
jgi:hypothetical protein